jgi:acyl carrier protein
MEVIDFFKTQIVGYNNDIDVTQINDDTHLSKDLGLDSLDLVEICMEIESEYKIIIPDSEVEEWKYVKDVIKSTERKDG